MRTCESSSLVEESAMDDTNVSANKKLRREESNLSEVKGGGGDDDDAEEEDCDVEVWNTLSKSFRLVQAILDQNRNLIKQVNENHRSMIPDNLNKNVSLISEINRNISKVISIYSDLSVNFSNTVQERRRIKNGSRVDRTDS